MVVVLLFDRTLYIQYKLEYIGTDELCTTTNITANAFAVIVRNAYECVADTQNGIDLHAIAPIHRRLIRFDCVPV